MQFGYRQLILWVVALFVAVGTVTPVLHSTSAWGDDPCAVQHPLKPPNKEFTGQCSVCGMMRPMWARTWMTFRNSEGNFGVCSFHCLADKALKSGEEPTDVMAALYLEPKKIIPGTKAFFVVGSKARGTMTMKSKLTFPSRVAAEKFAKSCGGKVVGFAEALKMAKAMVSKENQMIGMKRLKMGKIVEPVDNKDTCPVCNMYPARYPKSKCQIMSKDNKVYHFCSTQCLFEFLRNAKKYAKSDVKPVLIWVTDYPSGAWIGARAAYYVVGSKVQGPMGHEAFAYDKKKVAEEFAKKEGGKVLVFSQVGPDEIRPK
jgi:copper chaperone NosL